MEQLSKLLKDNETWLMEQILSYSKRHNYTKYTSTLLDAWRLSISGLTDALCMNLHMHGIQEPQLHADENYTNDPVTEFGRLEARRHRARGINISMFLGLFKYYRDTYIDLIIEKSPEKLKEPWIRFILKSFDRFEISLSAEWITTKDSEHIAKIEETNRHLSNEKNKYLTLFESTPRPAFLIDRKGLLDNLNLAAAQLLGLSKTSGEMYYSKGHSTLDKKVGVLHKPLRNYLPWIEKEATSFLQGNSSTQRIETNTDLFGAHKYFDVFFARMLDVSDKFTGILIIIDDITQRKQLEDQLSYLATTDALTGANNLHRFLERGEEEMEHAKRYERPLSLIMLDIDHFKAVNDTYGHAVGDDVLRSLSTKCREILRLTDLFGRIGGEEFAAVLPETDLEEARLAAERVRRALSQLKIDGPDSSISFTVSIGVVEREENKNLADVIQNADKALYEAKHMGRNRVVTKTRNAYG
ncbi:sensor domain-containing diguanylate cyclase [Maridesulfovibrio zosterae]|uniref:sensor domain-containing diguanylate cyclase n=1 Tax=Maridesulfovibrio zosterae TaxID=82171 RepID=UPI0004001757|nr:sensor domain-containing diguanylate cyclase [Maridesulfovibrio zosterae]